MTPEERADEILVAMYGKAPVDVIRDVFGHELIADAIREAVEEDRERIAQAFEARAKAVDDDLTETRRLSCSWPPRDGGRYSDAFSYRCEAESSTLRREARALRARGSR